MSRHHTHRTKRAHRHRKEFFQREPRHWSVGDFVTYEFRKLPQPTTSTGRSILRSWTDKLKAISKCKRKGCCSKTRRNRATNLYEAYKQTGPTSDKAAAKQVLKSLMQQAPVSVTVDAMFVNNRDVHYTKHSSALANNPTTPSAGLSADKESSDEHSDEESDEESGEESDEECDEESDQQSDEQSEKESDVADVQFENTYSSFTQDRKWPLPCGSTVEDILYQASKTKGQKKGYASVDSCVRNWTVDIDNPHMKALFDPKDWDAILAEVTPVPPVDPQFVESITRRFSGVKTTADLRKVLDTSSYNNNGSMEYDFDKEWVEIVLRQLLILYEKKSLNNLAKYGERWYDTHLWSVIIDKCMLSLPDVILDRCEHSSQSYMLRKNCARTDVSARVKTGPRLDGLLHDSNNPEFEYCVIESARLLRGGTISNKWIQDKAKVRKALLEILSRLAIEAKHERKVVDHLQVFGISTAGLTIQISRMTHHKGYVCVLKADEAVAIPQDVQQFQQLLVVLAVVLKTKLAIARTIEVFRQRSSANDQQTLFDAMMNAGDGGRPNGTMPRPADTP